MKFIKPSEISGKIMTLIDESDEFVLMVSPYINIIKWYKFLNTLKKLETRNVPFKFIIREDEEKAARQLQSLGYKFDSIRNLHSKLYINEKFAIVSSMNLLLSSEMNSLEIAYMTETKEEYDELIEYCSRHLNVDFDIPRQNNNLDFKGDWRDYVWQVLSEKLNARIKMEGDEFNLHINTGVNNYTAFIWNTKQNYLRISGILANREYELLRENPGQLNRIEGLAFELIEGRKGYYDAIHGISENPLNSENIDDLKESDKAFVAESIINFVSEIDEFKIRFREIQRSMR